MKNLFSENEIFSLQKTTKDSLNLVVGEIKSAKLEKREVFLKESVKESAKSFYDETVLKYQKSKFFLSFFVCSIFLIDLKVFSDSQIETFLFIKFFSLFLSIILFDDLSEKGYLKSIINAVHLKSDLELDTITYYVFGYAVKFKLQKLVIYTLINTFLFSSAIYFSNDFFGSVFLTLSLIISVIEIIFFQKLFTRKVK